jgi:hypothetical protein
MSSLSKGAFVAFLLVATTAVIDGVSHASEPLAKQDELSLDAKLKNRALEMNLILQNTLEDQQVDNQVLKRQLKESQANGDNKKTRRAKQTDEERKGRMQLDADGRVLVRNCTIILATDINDRHQYDT